MEIHNNLIYCYLDAIHERSATPKLDEVSLSPLHTQTSFLTHRYSHTHLLNLTTHHISLFLTFSLSLCRALSLYLSPSPSLPRLHGVTSASSVRSFSHSSTRQLTTHPKRCSLDFPKTICMKRGRSYSARSSNTSMHFRFMFTD